MRSASRVSIWTIGDVQRDRRTRALELVAQARMTPPRQQARGECIEVTGDAIDVEPIGDGCKRPGT